MINKEANNLFIYIDYFINLIQQCNYNNISGKAISAILEKNNSFIYHALKNEKFVNHYGDVIKQYMIKNNSAELIIEAEDSKNNDN